MSRTYTRSHHTEKGASSNVVSLNGDAIIQSSDAGKRLGRVRRVLGALFPEPQDMKPTEVTEEELRKGQEAELAFTQNLKRYSRGLGKEISHKGFRNEYNWRYGKHAYALASHSYKEGKRSYQDKLAAVIITGNTYLGVVFMGDNTTALTVLPLGNHRFTKSGQTNEVCTEVMRYDPALHGETGTYTFGKSVLDTDDPDLAGFHAEITLHKNGEFDVRDLGSREGTFIIDADLLRSPYADEREIAEFHSDVQVSPMSWTPSVEV